MERGALEGIGKKGITGYSLELIKNLYEGHQRRVKTVGGKTKWLPCHTGVRQGCILSPLLFSIYIEELGDRLAKHSKGVKLGGMNITALAFADDVVLIASDAEDLQNQLEILYNFCINNKMKVHGGKTKVMRVGGPKDDFVWELSTPEGEPIMSIQETNLSKYLGAWFGNSRVWQQHMAKKKQEARWRILKLKNSANDGRDPGWLANAGWQSAIRPSVLYGAEVINYTKTWMREIETIQNKLGKWILGVGMDAPSAGVRGELGWPSILEEIAKRKIIFWDRVKNMDENVWVKKAMEWILSAPYVSETYKSLEWARELLGEPELFGLIRGNALKRAIKKKICENWKADINTKLVGYPKKTLEGKVKYAGRGAVASTMAKFRLGCVQKQWEVRNGPCTLCGEIYEDIRIHILWECASLPPPWQGWRTILDSNEPPVAKLEKILKNQTWDNMSQIYQRWKAFTQHGNLPNQQ